VKKKKSNGDEEKEWRNKPPSGVKMKPTAQAVGAQEVWITSPEGAKEPS
jgi:hypothetical protein